MTDQKQDISLGDLVGAKPAATDPAKEPSLPAPAEPVAPPAVIEAASSPVTEAERPVETHAGQCIQQPTKFQQPSPDEALRPKLTPAEAIAGPASEYGDKYHD